MANIYVDDNTKKKLDDLCEKEHRAISDEVEFLIDNRIIELAKNGSNS